MMQITSEMNSTY